MNNFRRAAALVLAAVMVICVLAGCGSNNAPAQQPAQETKPAETAQETKPAETADTGYTARKFTVGTVGGGLPYSLLEDNGNWTGVEGELWAEIIERTGWEVEVKRCADMTSLFGELDSKRIDVAANCAAITASRLEAHIASDPIYADAQVVVVQPDSEYQTFEDLRGQVMGCTAGQAAQNTVEKMAPDYDWEIRPYENTGALFQDLDLGRIPSLAHTVSTVEKYQREQGLKLRMLDEKLFGNNVGWWFRDDEESKDLRDELNKVLAEMQEDGTISAITEKYFYEDMTKLISDEWLTSTK